ncbi:cytochrome family subfamily polypeptide 55 precursor [Stylonychia lemnae]|uniref:Cytochrome family subfamily polypeptide 55 n=1 Tax=Stylonychia lemnae TaxID=5949 RepID=A0A078AI34_STYLE|nr:cytochrome family subfamily polypeptide 55 precursor [Stylonychia lemnae]|eukprot:CDW80458.1 cytochrome family subfamily polypeptide 55 precursor [Stylonychia lemnae]
MILQTFILLVFGYIVWEKVIKLYYNYWYYTSQGIKATDFPLPIIGALHKFAMSLRGRTLQNEHPTLEYFKSRFGDNMPPIIYDMKIPTGALIINDPEIVLELFTGAKAKYVEKWEPMKPLYQSLIGKKGVISMQTKDPSLAVRRKHVSAAFYKDRLTKQLEDVIRITFDRVNDIKEDLKKQKDELNLIQWVGDLVMYNIQVCVFGIDCAKQELGYHENGSIQQLSVAMFLKKVTVNMFMRMIKVHRLCFSTLNSFFIGQSERDYKKNAEIFRQFLKNVIQERKNRIKLSKDYQIHDFLDILLTDDLYEGKDEDILDECCVFMLAATQTTLTAINNTLIYIYKEGQILQKLRSEVTQNFPFNDISEVILFVSYIQVTTEMWIKQFNYDKMAAESTYIQKVVLEALRIEPPLRLTSRYELSEDLELKGYKIKKGQPLAFNIWGLANDPKTWIEPEKFIPERFDTESKYFLTPDGKKRKSTSFITFFGGLRVCIGKTFAESVIKTICPIVIANFNMEFKDKSLYERKIPISVDVEPEIFVKISLNTQKI